MSPREDGVRGNLRFPRSYAGVLYPILISIPQNIVCGYCARACDQVFDCGATMRAYSYSFVCGCGARRLGLFLNDLSQRQF